MVLYDNARLKPFIRRRDRCYAGLISGDQDCQSSGEDDEGDDDLGDMNHPARVRK